jgi:hypothetical protein
MVGSIEPSGHAAGAADAGGKTVEIMTILAYEREGGM